LECAGLDSAFSSQDVPSQKASSRRSAPEHSFSLNMETSSEKRRGRQWSPVHVFKRRMWAFSVGSLLAALVLAFFVAPLTSPQYLGRIRLQFLPLNQEHEIFRSYFPETKPTQFEIIKNKETLFSVIDDLQLVKRWDDATDRAEAYSLLVEMVQLEEVQGTNLSETLDRLDAVDLVQPRAAWAPVSPLTSELLMRMPAEESSVDSPANETDAVSLFPAELVIRMHSAEESSVNSPASETDAVSLFPDKARLVVTAADSNHLKDQSMIARDVARDKLLKEGVTAVICSLGYRLEIATERVANFEAATENYARAKQLYESRNSMLTEMRQVLKEENVTLLNPNESVIIHETSDPIKLSALSNISLHLAAQLLSGGILFLFTAGTACMYLVHALRTPHPLSGSAADDRENS
jgi:hypothetical protein